eukprot:2829617-Rhodomonas_salina.2
MRCAVLRQAMLLRVGWAAIRSHRCLRVCICLRRPRYLPTHTLRHVVCSAQLSAYAHAVGSGLSALHSAALTLCCRRCFCTKHTASSALHALDCRASALHALALCLVSAVFSSSSCTANTGLSALNCAALTLSRRFFFFFVGAFFLVLVKHAGLSALHRLELLALSSNRLASLDGLPPLPSLK